MMMQNLQARLAARGGLVCALVCALAGVGCSGGGDSAPSNTTQQNTQGPTYYPHIQQLVQTHCDTCHVPGGAGPFALDTYDALKPLAQASLASMRTRSMPPWLPDPTCREFIGQRRMTDEEIITFSNWVDAGMPQGDPANAVTPVNAQPLESFEPDHRVDVSGGYVPDARDSDDYHCFVLDDLTFDQDTFINATRVVPGSGLVHHVLVYAISPRQLELVRKLDEAEDGPGYTCFGGPTASKAEDQGDVDGELPVQLGAWVPGSRPASLGEGVGTRVEAGSKIVVQIHYSLLGGQPAPDDTTLEIKTLKETPTTLSVVRPLPILELDIPPGVAEVKHVNEFPYYGKDPLTIRSVSPHMHLLGSRFEAEVVRPDFQKQCMLNIPRWDFGWQQSYATPAGSHTTLTSGDRVRVRCFYDNSPENQPVVDGDQLSPRHVKWGDGTLDEMCILYVELLKPYTPTPALTPDTPVCTPAQDCMAACPEGQGIDCLLRCQSASFACQTDALSAVGSCALSPCGTQFLAARQCLTTCLTSTLLLDSDTGLCMASECATEYQALTTCAGPKLEEDACKAGLSSVGLSMPAR